MLAHLTRVGLLQWRTLMATDGDAIRLNKRLSQMGLCSRREADRYIAAGQVLVDGQPVSELGLKVWPDQVVQLAAVAQGQQQALQTVLLHKPTGWVSGQAEDGHRPAMDLITPERLASPGWTPWGDGPWPQGWWQGLAPAGRLDLDSSGLLVLTQEGPVARRLVGGHGEVDKEYLVAVTGRVDRRAIGLLREGLQLDGVRLRRARIERLNDGRLRFVLRQGRKRQIRRMCTLVGLQVTKLHRVRIGGVHLADLPVGKWRFLRASEIF